MPVTDPICEQIAKVIKQRLDHMVSGGWPNNIIQEVVRPTRKSGYTPKARQLVILDGEVEENEELSHPGNPPAIAWDHEYMIFAHVLPSEDDPTPLDEYRHSLHADVTEAMTDAGAEWYTMGNLAINSRIAAPLEIDEGAGMNGVVIPVVVTYRVSEWSPYESRV